MKSYSKLPWQYNQQECIHHVVIDGIRILLCYLSGELEIAVRKTRLTKFEILSLTLSPSFDVWLAV